MPCVKNQIIDPVRLTAEDGQYFFGYYDIPAFSQNMQYHLCHRAKVWKRLPREDDVVELGMIDMKSKEFLKLAETTAWNFQQGAMLQWNPRSPNREMIFNVLEGENYRGIVMDVNTKEKKVLDMPVASIDPSGQYALSINFSRLYDFRPGYGYAGLEDPYRDKNHPPDDGVFLIDLKTGRAKLLISLDEIWEKTKAPLGSEDRKILINHITFNTDGTRFVFLVRNFTKTPPWKTAVLTADIDGGDIYILSNYAVASHYHWKDPEHIVFYAQCTERSPQGLQLYLLRDKSYDVKAVDTDFFRGDGHCSYSPDRKWLLYDSYPDRTHYRHLYLYNLEAKKGVELGAYHHAPKLFEVSVDIRCDLHPRWSPDGKGISFDSIHEGGRHIYYADLEEVMESFYMH